MQMLESRYERLMVALVCEGGLGVAAFAVGWLVGFWPAIGMGWSSPPAQEQVRGILLGFAATIPPLVALFALDRFQITALDEVRELAAEGARRIFPNPQVWQLALLSLVAGFGEELLFRGLAQGGLTQLIGGPAGPWIALVVVAVLFGIAHWLSTTYSLLALIAGLYFGVLLILTGSLWVPIVAHATYDFIALWYLIRSQNHVELTVEE
jgi:membrane protease YdiL (CAAX protease family)